MKEDASARPAKGWPTLARRWPVLLFAWSLPVSLFGMQAGVALGAVCLPAVAIATRGNGMARSPLDMPLALLLGVIGLSLLAAPGGPTSFRTATSFWVIASFYLVWLLLDEPRTLRLAVYGMLALACLAACLGVYQSLTADYPLFDVFHPAANPELRLVPVSKRPSAVGFFFSRLTFAHVMLFPFCWGTGLALEPLGLRKRMLLGLAVVLMGAGILTTWTRAAPLAALAALVLLVLTRLGRGSGRRLLALVVVLLIAGAVAFLAPTLVKRLEKSFSGRADWTRLAIWHTALDMAARHPACGVGYGNFQRDAVAPIQKRVANVGAKRFPGVIAWAHNNLLTFLAEMGMLGALLLCLLLVAYFRSAGRCLGRVDKDDHFSRGFVRGSLAAVGAFLAVGMFHDTFFDGEVAFCLWFTLAASLAAGRLAGREAAK